MDPVFCLHLVRRHTAENGVIRGRERLTSLVLEGLLAFMDDAVWRVVNAIETNHLRPTYVRANLGQLYARKLSPGLPEVS